MGAAVLIRALEPLVGVEEMRARGAGATRGEHELCSGPGKLTQALGVELAENGTSLSPGRSDPCAGRAPLAGDNASSTGPRIGITKAVDLPWRFCLAGNTTSHGLGRVRQALREPSSASR